MAEATTTKKELTDAELSAILDIPGTQSALNTQNTIFTPVVKVGDDILDNIDKLTEEEKKQKAEAAAAKLIADKKGEEILKGVLDTDAATEEDELDENGQKKVADPGTGAGRPKTDKTLIAKVFAKLIEEKKILPFDEELDEKGVKKEAKKIEDYTEKDYLELIEGNFKHKEETLSKELPVKFLESLSPALQHLANFEYKGGTDIRPVLQAMLKVEETRELDPTKEKDQEEIIRNWLSLTNVGTAEEIEEEITATKDIPGALEKKAKQFKPKLDAKHQEQITKEIADQDARKKQSLEALQNYHDDIVAVLKPSELNGIKLDNKTQSLLYNGLTSFQYQSALTGRPTNLLGHLIEKFQTVEPNRAMIAEVLWHLADPEGFKEQVKKAEKKATTEDAIRKLKIEEGNKNNGGGASTEEDETKRGKKSAIKREKPSIFSRLE